MKAKEIAELLDEPACEHNKKSKSGCAKPKPGSAEGDCVFDGARGLRGILESALRQTMFELRSKENIGICVADEKEVNSAAEFIVSEIIGARDKLDHAEEEQAASVN
jgi:hypothetical protein